MKSAQQRLSNIVGQIEGIKKMLDTKTECIAVLTQLKAVKSAVAGVMDTVVENQFDTCLKSLNDKDKQLLIKMKNYVKSN
jgi:DNA-binding FrmR family transcriptional regulator